MAEELPEITLTPEQQAQCQALCDRIAQGESLRKICKDDGMPPIGTFLGWVIRSKALADQYTRARDVQMDVWAEECLEIADDDAKDFGFKAVKNEDGQSAEVFINKDNIQRSKLRIDERHWQMSKQRPKKYGDLTRHEHTDGDGKSIPFSVTVTFVKPDGPASPG